jgi:Tol biopolymer transport system component
MTLSPGTRLGPYEIAAPIGAGGMGEVYKARDTRLGRTVAIKVLRGTGGADPDRRRRFEQEARAVSALNHPHICVLHDIGSSPQASGGPAIDYLVMEYLEGETLAHRLRKGPLPVPMALEIGAQMCDALSRAHRHGIVHRDVKPANVMLTKDGPKLLDFGLAKLRPQPTSGAGGLSALSTQAATAAGTVAGTVPYMAPEQLEGKEADARTDLFAFGCVLFEMLTGRRAFLGDSEASVISAIMASQSPAVSAIRPLTPPALDRLVSRCLQKDPDDRAESAHDIAEELRSLAETIRTGDTVQPVAPRKRHWWIPAAMAAVGAVALAGAVGGWWTWRKGPTPRYLDKALPVGVKLVLGTPAFALAPDGSGVVWQGVGADGKLSLFWYGLEDAAPHQLWGTVDASAPFFSPDGQWLGFARGGKLLKIPFGSGMVPEGSKATGTGLWRVSASGGDAQNVSQPDPRKREFSHRWPSFLPGGRFALFTVMDSSGRMESNTIAIFDLETNSRTTLVTGGSDARYLASGQLVFARRGSLLAVPFDIRTRSTRGTPIPVLTGVQLPSDGSGSGGYDVTRGGTLVYTAAGTPEPKSSLVWVGRDGKETPALPDRDDRHDYHPNFSLSPNQDRLAISYQSGDSLGLWTYHFATGRWKQLTSKADAHSPVWSPKGDRIVFPWNVDGPYNLYTIRPDEERPAAERLTRADQWQYPFAWSPDGKFITYQQMDGKLGWNTYVLPINADGKAGAPWRWGREGAKITLAAFSPDGRWLAYQSNETGKFEVYVRPFPGPGKEVSISDTEGGLAPVWSSDGEILYLPPTQGNNRVLGAQLEPGREPRVLSRGVAFALSFSLPSVLPQQGRVIALSKDGRRILTIQQDPGIAGSMTTAQTPHLSDMRVVTNWHEHVKAKLAERR